MALTLGDAFSRRKQLGSEIENWMNRLRLTGRTTLQYRTELIEGPNAFQPQPGSVRSYERTYTIEECRSKLAELISEDRELALRISLTNQMATATVLDLDGVERTYSIPELLVLKNDIASKMEESLRAVPLQSTGVEVVEEGEDFSKWRTITKYLKREQTMGQKGNVIENQVLDYYQVEEVTDYGLPTRQIHDEIDDVHAWLVRVREAVNQANKTDLVDLPAGKK